MTKKFQHLRQEGIALATPLPPPEAPGADPRVWIIAEGTGGSPWGPGGVLPETVTGGNLTLWTYSDPLPMFSNGFHDVCHAVDFSFRGDPFGYAFVVVGAETPDGPVHTARMQWDRENDWMRPDYAYNAVSMHQYEPTFDVRDDASCRYHIAAGPDPPNPEVFRVTANGFWDFVAAKPIAPASTTSVFHSLCVLHSIRGDGTAPHSFIYTDAGSTPARYRLLTTYTFTSGPTTRHPGHTERIELWYAALDVNEAGASNYNVWWDADDPSQGDAFAPGQQQVMTVNLQSHKPATLAGYQIAEIYNSATRPTSLNVTYPSVSVPPFDYTDPDAFNVAIPMLYCEPTPFSASGAGSIIPVQVTGSMDNVSPLAVGEVHFGNYTMMEAWPDPPFPFESVEMGRCGFRPNSGDGSGDTFSVGAAPAATSPVWKAYGITAVFVA